MAAETPPYRNRDRARLVREIPFQAEPAFRDPQLDLVSAIDQPRSCQLENAAVKKDGSPKAGPRQFQTCEAPSRTAAYKNRLFPRRQFVAEPNRSCLHAPRDKPGLWRQSLPFAALRGASEARRNRFFFGRIRLLAQTRWPVSHNGKPLKAFSALL
ncbi:hypothetical protein [Mesorhizobium argentiipisi]|uniref:Uncharacterized protein n=1 Tax=Mesorhizobium argentiipisi TaxID=3015175 RepID=A0ABU8K8B3_9HYPH